jgi:predicted Zn-dependent protease
MPVYENAKWQDYNVTWYYNNDADALVNLNALAHGYYAPDLWLQEIQQAFSYWDSVSNLTFTQVSNYLQADIHVSWGENFPDGNGNYQYQQQGGILGQTSYSSTAGYFNVPVDIIFDAYEVWAWNNVGDYVLSNDEAIGANGYTFYALALHEIGHAIGLDHRTDTLDTIMTEFASPSVLNLTSNDIAAIQYLYGSGTSQPDLTPYQPSGWSDEIVVSTVTGGHSDSSTIYSNQNVYVDWAVLNNGSGNVSSTFYTYLYVDGIYKTSWFTSSLSANSYAFVNDYSLGTLSAGTHTIKIVTDATGAITESSDGNNEYTKTITVTAPPQGSAAPHDFNGDGTSDILLQNSSGWLVNWTMQNGSMSSWQSLGVQTGWSAKGTGDFNHDGTTDILLQNSSGWVVNWTMQNGSMSSWQSLGVQTGWNVVGTGDFNHDGTTDVLLQNNSGWLVNWTMQNGSMSSWQSLGVQTGWSVKGTGDFNHDGTTDVVLENGSGWVVDWMMQNGSMSSWNSLGVQTGWLVV